MKNSLILRTTVCACLFGIYSAIAIAENITINITAEVAQIRDSEGLLDGMINIGDTLTGSYTYDSTTQDNNPLPTVGDYWHTSPPFGITIHGGELVFQTDPANVYFLVEIVNDHGSTNKDNYLLHSYYNLPLSDDVYVERISWQLDDPTHTALSSIELPLVPPTLSDWQSIIGLTITGCSVFIYPGQCDVISDTFFIRAHVTQAELDVAETPEDLINSLIDTVVSLDLKNGIFNALYSKLTNILRTLEDTNQNNDDSAINMLYAFIYNVEAQRGKAITDADADTLIAAAQEIIDLLSE
ncbi:MAG: hypothetical protein LJE83_11570 [Gammaproteobacteria bacterium]|nr:hypothetical protein [Gammaproteobacteria bacterium]